MYEKGELQFKHSDCGIDISIYKVSLRHPKIFLYYYFCMKQTHSTHWPYVKVSVTLIAYLGGSLLHDDSSPPSPQCTGDESLRTDTERWMPLKKELSGKLQQLWREGQSSLWLNQNWILQEDAELRKLTLIFVILSANPHLISFLRE